MNRKLLLNLVRCRKVFFTEGKLIFEEGGYFTPDFSKPISCFVFNVGTGTCTYYIPKYKEKCPKEAIN